MDISDSDLADDRQTAFISEGICPICKAGELLYEGLNNPDALND